MKHLIILALLFLISCKEEVTGPELKQPGRVEIWRDTTLLNFTFKVEHNLRHNDTIPDRKGYVRIMQLPIVKFFSDAAFIFLPEMMIFKRSADGVSYKNILTLSPGGFSFADNCFITDSIDVDADSVRYEIRTATGNRTAAVVSVRF